MAESLWIYLGVERVARLDHEHGELSLQYDSPGSAALSVRLPARTEPYPDAVCRPFFTNLLPEGSWRAALCRELGIAPDDDFGLLEAIGTDCAGAVTIRAEPDWVPEHGRYVPTTEADLTRWVKDPATRPQVEVAPGLRLSLAGAQDKLLIHLEDGRPFLCEQGAPSTVILKPSIIDPLNAIELSAVNELFSMQLAGTVGLLVPRTFWFAAAFATERFDRALSSDGWRRLHQEDFAQILGIPAAAKYSVGWTECFEIVSRFTTTPARARLELLDRLLFNLVLGNHDAHGKNFALLHAADGSVRLAPAYDLLCTQVYPRVSATFAMPVGSAVRLDELDPEAWRAFAKAAFIAFPFLRQRALTLSAAVSAALQGAAKSLDKSHPALRSDVYPARRRLDFLRGLCACIEQNCRILARSVDPT